MFPCTPKKKVSDKLSVRCGLEGVVLSIIINSLTGILEN